MGLIFNGNGDVIRAVDGSLTVEGIDLGGSTNINAGIGTFSGNLNVGGVLTYEDVKNVDSVGIITARDGVHITGDNKYLKIGAGNDLQLVHTGGETFITNSTGHLTHRSDVHKWENYNASSEYARFTSTGLGIGINAPTRNLHIDGTAHQSGIIIHTAGNHSTAIDMDSNRSSAAGGLAELNFKWNGTAVGQIGAYAGADTTNKDDGHIHFGTASAGSIVERLRITSAGNLLIGKTVDSGKSLEVYQAGDAAIRIQNNASGTGNNDGILFEIGNTSKDALIWNYESANMLFGTAGTERLRIDSSGRLQIGASNNSGANTKLVVGAGNNINTTAIINTGDVDVDALTLSNWDGSTTTNKVTIHFDSSGIGGWNIGMPAATDAFVIEDDGGAERLHINSGGGCHIGLPAITKAWDTHAISVTTNSATFACPGTLSVFGGTGFATANMAGGGIRFVGYYAAGAFTTFAHVAGVKENTTSGHYGGALTFHTRTNGSLGAERLRIDSSGFIKQKFTSNNSTTAEGLFINNLNNGTGNNASLIFSNDSGERKKAAIAHIDNGNYGHGDFVFALDGGDSGALHLTNDERVRIRPSGVDYTLKVKGADQVEGYSCNTWSASMYFSSGATHTICTFSTGGNDSQAVATMDYASLYSYASNNRWGGQVMAIARKTSSNSSAEATNNIDAATGGTDSNIKPTFFWDVSTPGAVKLKVTTGSSVQVVGRIQVTYRTTWTLTRNYSAE